MTKKPKNAGVVSKAYDRLAQKIQARMLKAGQVIGRQYVLLYWSTGKDMDGYLKNPLHSESIRALARKLSGKLSVDERTLEQSLQFYRAYPALDRKQLLTWSHYRQLIAIDSPKERSLWERKALAQNINSNDFSELLRESRRHHLDSKTIPQLVEPKKGKVYHYRLIKVNTVNDISGGMMVDCGFSNRIMPPPADAQLNAQRFVRSEKDEHGYRLKIARVSKEDIFTYRAFVERVVDGDTLLTEVDCGFGLYSRQYLRLRGIDASEISTTAGLRAKRFVEKQLKDAPFVIVKTEKSEKYDRYLADVWIGDIYLNQLLLDKGLVELYK